jgi:hypothetical protein
MGWHCDFKNTVAGSFLKTNVTSSLSNNYEPGALESFDNPVER